MSGFGILVCIAVACVVLLIVIAVLSAVIGGDDE